MERTLIHEEIYAYVDPIEEQEVTEVGNSVKFVNDARESIVNNGVLIITVKSGNFTKVVISDGNKTLSIENALKTGDSMVLNFNELHFTKNGSLFFTDEIFELFDNEYHVINVDFTGSGSVETTYKFFEAREGYEDLMFLESLSVDTSIERTKKTLYNGKEKNLNSKKKVHSFGINGLWSQDEMNKFPELFRLRLIDEEGNTLETLANCSINSKGISSSSGGGDLTYAISGSCEQIF